MAKSSSKPKKKSEAAVQQLKPALKQSQKTKKSEGKQQAASKPASNQPKKKKPEATNQHTPPASKQQNKPVSKQPTKKAASKEPKKKSSSKKKPGEATKRNDKKAVPAKKKQDEAVSKQETKSEPKQQKKSESKQVWKYSEAKKVLVAGLTNGDIPLDAEEMPAEIVYQQHPEFASFTLKHFTERLKYNRQSIAAKKKRANAEMEAFLHDQAIHPTQPYNQFGRPRWEGSDAERSLRLDMDQGMHLTMKPMQLYYTRPEYHQVFTLEEFRKHIDQERRGRRYIDFLTKKRQQKEDKRAKKSAKLQANK